MRRRTDPCHFAALLTLCVSLLTPFDASAQQLRFSDTTDGAIIATGNTLGLSKAWNQNGPGVEDSIGAFTSLDVTSTDDSPVNVSNPWPMATTWDWSQNGSEAALMLPPWSEVLYAELVWAGSYAYIDDVSAYLDTPVTLSFGGVTTQVTPDPATALTMAETSYTGFAANYYIRSAEVTAFVQQHGGGNYAVQGVPATQDTGINSLSAAGWTLVVAFRSEDQPTRNLSVFVGGSFVDEDTQQDYTVDGFCAPPFGPVEGSIVVSALEGDADLTGDELLVSQTSQGPFVGLSGPNNPSANFFCSQLNDQSGNVDQQGSFGDANHDAHNGINVPAGRQGWDVTTVPISADQGHLVNGQTSAVVRTNTTGDSFVPTLVAIELDVKSPDFTDGSTAGADRDIAGIGEEVNLSITLSNSGEALADNLLLSLDVDAGLDVTGLTIDGTPGDANGGQVSDQALASGVPIGQIDVGETLDLVLTFVVVDAPENGDNFLFLPYVSHSFIVCDGDPAVSGTYNPVATMVAYDAAPSDGGVGGDPGDGSTGSGDSTGSGIIHDDTDSHTEGSCACSTPGGSNETPWPLLFLALGVYVARRPKRRSALSQL